MNEFKVTDCVAFAGVVERILLRDIVMPLDLDLEDDIPVDTLTRELAAIHEAAERGLVRLS